jgi:catechol 2,3-dioxygenase-like lactoylglutathione lyase family enzyme
MIRGIHHLAIHVKDLDRIVKFYKDAFGFEQVGSEIAWRNAPLVDSLIGLKDSAARTVMLHAGSCYLEVFEYEAPQPREAGAAVASDRGYTHFCVDVTDIDAECERLANLGMRFHHTSPGDAGSQKFIYGQDPEGNLIELLETTRSSDFELAALKRTL